MWYLFFILNCYIISFVFLTGRTDFVRRRRLRGVASFGVAAVSAGDASPPDLPTVHRGAHRHPQPRQQPLRRVREGGRQVRRQGQQHQSGFEDHQESVRASQEGRRGACQSSQK